MNHPLSVVGKLKSRFMPISRGFTLVELMIVMGIVGISVALAVPIFKTVGEKREITKAAETIVSFLTLAQSEAVKRNEKVTVSWFTSGGHSSNWCIGATEGATACDCKDPDLKTTTCKVEDQPFRLAQADFVDKDSEFMHMRVSTGKFAFDPVRGIITDPSSTDIFDPRYIFYIHSEKGSGRSRDYELEIRLNVTGRVYICTDLSRQKRIGGYTPC
jgi:prepilin-type N-terminal cleavage/methylation domain-containing protein